jgi:hypothetical protein
MSKEQRVSHKTNMEAIKDNEFAARYWKAQNDMMSEILRNVELLPKYQAYLDSLKESIKEDANTQGEETQEEGVQ